MPLNPGANFRIDRKRQVVWLSRFKFKSHVKPAITAIPRNVRLASLCDNRKGREPLITTPFSELGTFRLDVIFTSLRVELGFRASEYLRSFAWLCASRFFCSAAFCTFII